MKKELLIPSYLNIAEKIGLNSDDVVYLAVDLSNLSKVCRERGELFNSRQFIESFQSILKTGTLIVPAFTGYLEDGATFDIKSSEPDSGVFSGFVWKMPDFERTTDPLHSVMVWGHLKEELLGLEHNDAYGEQSVFAFLRKYNAKIVIIDYHLQDSFPYVHFIEQRLQVRYRTMSFRKYTIATGEDNVEKEYKYFRKKAWVLNDFYDLQTTMSSEGIKLNYFFDSVKIQFIEIEKAQDFIKRYIRSGKRVYQIDLLYFVKGLMLKPYKLLKRKK